MRGGELARMSSMNVDCSPVKSADTSAQHSSPWNVGVVFLAPDQPTRFGL
jgi:hypothetical protein